MERRTYLGKHHYLLLQDAETGADIVTSLAAGAKVKSVQNAFLSRFKTDGKHVLLYNIIVERGEVHHARVQVEQING